jgi:hypothetical protein
MTTFEEKNKALLLYKGEDDEELWSLYAWESHDGRPMQQQIRSKDASFLTHQCAHAEQVAEVYVFPDTHTRCWRCTAEIPDGLRALWILHNGEI